MKEIKTRHQKQHVLLRVLRQLRSAVKWLLLAAALDAAAVGCAVAAPEILGNLVQMLYDFWKAGGVGQIRGALLTGLFWLLMVYAVSSTCSYWNMRLMENVTTRNFTCGMRIQISEKIMRLPVRYVDQTQVGDILSRMMDDVGQMGGCMHQVFDATVKGAFQILLITAAMLWEDWRLAILVLVLTPASLYLSSRIAAASEKHYDAMFEREGKLTEIVEETFSNFSTGKAYNLEKYVLKKHTMINQAMKDAETTATFTGSMVQPLIQFTNSLAYILINLIGGILIIRQGVGIGAVVTMILYTRQFAAPLELLARGFSQINQMRAAAKRVFALLDLSEEQEQTGALAGRPAGEVQFSHVRFSYKPEEPLIEDLSMTVHPGQKIAIVGPTGAGKTTIVNLLMRFYDPAAGTILLDGSDIGQVERSQIRGAFGMVLQDTWLFRGTIAQNVAYGKPDATMEEIRNACRRTYCEHFILTMPDGYDTLIGEDTTNLSGGQRQLLTIARALLADKPLLILDEATSNVDTRTEVMIQKAMDQLMAGKTCFVIAHRLSTIIDADLILVLNHGRIVEQGTHSSLLNAKGFYYQLYTSQYAV